MSKKGHLQSLSDMSCAENRQIRCSMCKSMEKSIYYVCKSGRHVICENCQQLSAVKNRKDDGDNIPEKEYLHASKKDLSFVNNSEMKLQDLASGDHVKTVESLKTPKSNKDMKKDKCRTLTTSTSNKDINSRNNSETTVVYRNTKFSDSKSSITSSVVSSQYDVCKEEHNSGRVPRPVACPVTNCSKMVTMNSISQHFNFDHSKVPRMILNKSGPQHIILNYSTLSADTICIASFIISQKRLSHTSEKKDDLSKSIHSPDKSSQLLLLMAAKISTTPIKLSDKTYLSRVSTRNSYTQTEDIQRQKEKCHKLSGSKSSSENTIWMNKSNTDNEDDEVILLWLCKLDDKNKSYTIMVSGEDKRQAYSYIGDAVHIRCEQDPFAVYSRAQCLSVRKAAINKLLTTENELKVVISTVP